MIHYDEYNIFDFVSGISEALDLAAPALNHHHKRVAYIAYSLARELSWDEREIFDLVTASILHDIGAFSQEERICLSGRTGFENVNPHEHAYAGYLLLRAFDPLAKAAEMVRYHHINYREGQSGIPRGSYVICLADRIAILIDDSVDILEQVGRITEQIKLESFPPEIIEALLRLSKREYFWVETYSDSVDRILASRIQLSRSIKGLNLLRSFAKTMSLIIDFRSRFTATHSSGVAAVALELTRLLAFSERECCMMEIAGFLHDLGKLAIPSEVLDKPGKLGYDEINLMRKHTYYTYQILDKIKGLEDVSMWASYHHERLDGEGYPFHIVGADLTKLSRTMAVADVFTAITEDRPYRRGMDAERAMTVLDHMVDQNAIDGGIVAFIKKHFDEINTKRIAAQKEAMLEYKEFSAQIDDIKMGRHIFSF